MTPDTPSQLRRNAILTIANLAAGNEKITRRVVYNQEIMHNVISHISIPGHVYEEQDYKWLASTKAMNPETKDEWKILKEALWVLSNIATLANDDCIWQVYILCIYIKTNNTVYIAHYYEIIPN